MTDLDERIRRAVQASDNPDPDLLPSEQNIWQMMIGVYRGKNRWLNILAIVYTFVFTGLAVWTAISFFDAETTKGMLGWGFGFTFCVLAVGNLKMWLWMQMDKNAVLREMKRLELQVALLAQRGGGG